VALVVASSAACTVDGNPGPIPAPIPAPDPTEAPPQTTPEPDIAEPWEPCPDGAEVVQVGDAKPGCNPDGDNGWRVVWPGSDGIEEAKFRAECDEMGGTLMWLTTTDPAGQFECFGTAADGHW
jgi:hypothetical protein